MLSKLQRNVPLEAKFGLHFGRFATLPTIEDFYCLQSQSPQATHRLHAIDISTYLPLLKEYPHYELALEIPTLGFSDLLHGYDINPWFAFPIAINGFVAQADAAEPFRAKVILTDITNQKYSYQVNKESVADYEAMANQQAKPIYSAIKAIQYCFGGAQIIYGEGLSALPNLKEFQNKLVLYLPRVQCPMSLKVTVLDKKRAIITNEITLAPKQVLEVTPVVQAKWAGSKEQGELNIQYHVVKDASLQYIQSATLHLTFPNQKGLKLLLHGEQSWLTTHHNKTSRLTQYIGLSQVAMADLLQQIVPFEHFESILLSDTQNTSRGGLRHVNDYTSCQSSRQQLYHYLLSGVLNRSVPLCALSDYFVEDKKLAHILPNMNIASWPLSDQLVYKHFLFGLPTTKMNCEYIIDEIDQLLSFGVSSVEGQLSIKTSGAKLPSAPKVLGQLILEPLPQNYPIEAIGQGMPNVLSNSQGNSEPENLDRDNPNDGKYTGL